MYFIIDLQIQKLQCILFSSPRCICYWWLCFIRTAWSASVDVCLVSRCQSCHWCSSRLFISTEHNCQLSMARNLTSCKHRPNAEPASTKMWLQQQTEAEMLPPKTYCFSHKSLLDVSFFHDQKLWAQHFRGDLQHISSTQRCS